MSRPTPFSPLTRHKIQASHTDRLAVVYVRQSHPQQVIRHQESTRLQYGLGVTLILMLDSFPVVT
jgi:hypothetical protein